MVAETILLGLLNASIVGAGLAYVLLSVMLSKDITKNLRLRDVALGKWIGHFAFLSFLFYSVLVVCLAIYLIPTSDCIKNILDIMFMPLFIAAAICFLLSGVIAAYIFHLVPRQH